MEYEAHGWVVLFILYNMNAQVLRFRYIHTHARAHSISLCALCIEESYLVISARLVALLLCIKDFWSGQLARFYVRLPLEYVCMCIEVYSTVKREQILARRSVEADF